MTDPNHLPKTIMVTETDADTRQLVKALLELEGFQVFETLVGRKASDVAQRERPELLLIQLKLPEGGPHET